MSDADLFLNRELSWLEFNARVLQQAVDPRPPLLERVRFLEIFRSNLDEFYMKRVGGLKRQALAQVSSAMPSGLTDPNAQISAIRNKLIPMLKLRFDTFEKEILPALEKEGICLVKWKSLTPEERAFACGFFEKNIFPVLTPLAVDPGHPFPFISNLSTSLGVLLKDPGRDGEPLFARIKIPDVFPSWIRVNPEPNASEARYVSLMELIINNLDSLFPGMDVIDQMSFRITRNADVERDEEDADDLLEMITEELRARRFASVVRLEHGPRPQPKLLQMVLEELELGEVDVYELPMYLEYYNLSPIAELNRPQLKFPIWVPAIPAQFQDPDSDIFAEIRNGDILVHHPYESFNASVERFIHNASEDPKVLAIKMALYRTGKDSPFIQWLIRAAENGKQVVCLVELKARFDEEKNILVAQELEKAGVHVVYGIVGLKTHCKVSLVVRQEADGVRSYAHIGTGNYHAQTAKLYTDLGLFTAKPEFTDDITHLFHYLTGLSRFQGYRKLLLAPLHLKDRFLELIEREINHARQGKPAHIIAKMNSLEDERICRALYDASKNGVKIDLIVRGFCTLRPGVPAVSENIQVISVIGRFLEHSRIFHFRNGAKDPTQGEFFIGSADWMYRNLSARVEAVVPIEDAALRTRCYEILQIMLDDQRQAWDMQPDGTYRQRLPRHPTQEVGTHAVLMNLAKSRNAPGSSGLPH